MQRRYLLCFALLPGLLAAARPTLAQHVTWPVYTGFYVQAGASFSPGLKMDSYDAFRESFNTVFRSSLRTPLGPWTVQRTYSFGGGAYIGPAYVSVVKHVFSTSAAAEYRNGDRRELTLDYNPLDINTDLMYPVGKRVVLGVAIGAQLQKVTIHSGYRYAANGLLSYGEEQPLNGIFRMKSEAAILMGGRFDWKMIKRHDHAFISLSLRSEYLGVLTHFVDPSPLSERDDMMAQATGGPNFNEGALRFYLPTDVRDRRDEYVTFVGLGDTFRSQLYGWRFSANLLITPFERKLN